MSEKEEIGRFLKEKLNLIMSEEKTLITNAGSQAAKFLGYEIKAQRVNDYIDHVSYTHLDVYKRQVWNWTVSAVELQSYSIQMPIFRSKVLRRQIIPVSYTHLDVYKRQPVKISKMQRARYFLRKTV